MTGLDLYRQAFDRLVSLCKSGVPFREDLAEVTSIVATWEAGEGRGLPRGALDFRWQVYRVRRSGGGVVREGEAGCWPGLVAAEACERAAAHHGGRSWDYEAERIIAAPLGVDEALRGIAIVLCHRGMARLPLPDVVGLGRQMPAVTLRSLHEALRKAVASEGLELVYGDEGRTLAVRHAADQVGALEDCSLVFKSHLREAGALEHLGGQTGRFARLADILTAELEVLAQLPSAVPYRYGVPSVERVAAHEKRGGWWQTSNYLSYEFVRVRRWWVRDGRIEELSPTRNWVAVEGVHACRPCADDGVPLPWDAGDQTSYMGTEGP